MPNTIVLNMWQWDTADPNHDGYGFRVNSEANTTSAKPWWTSDALGTDSSFTYNTAFGTGYDMDPWLTPGVGLVDQDDDGFLEANDRMIINGNTYYLGRVFGEDRVTVRDPNGEVSTLGAVTIYLPQDPTIPYDPDTNNIDFIDPTKVFSYWYKLPLPADPKDIEYVQATAGWETLNTFAKQAASPAPVPFPEAPAPLPCFCAGTLVETLEGSVAIEALKAGDQIWTQDHGYQAIRWIGKTVVRLGPDAATDKNCPVRIRAGALGDGLPQRDLLVSRQHRMVVSSKIIKRMFDTDEVLVPAIKLVGLPGIELATDLSETTYYHMLFDTHEIVKAEGALTESLYTGPVALDALGLAAREEIFDLFPQLRNRDYKPDQARLFVDGRIARKTVQRHMKNRHALIDA